MKSFWLLLPKRKNWRWAFFFALLLAITVVSTAYADVTFGNYTGPVWLNPGYQFTIDISKMKNPQNNINL